MEELEKGQKTKIKFSISPSRYYEVSCAVKWVENDRIGLAFPESMFQVAQYLFEGKPLEVLIYTDKGIFNFDSVVINTPYENDFVIELPEEQTKIQRREYVRVPISLELELNKTGKTIKTQTINIGGGGIRFRIDSELEVKDIWSFTLYVPNWNNPVKGFGEILYTVKQGKFMFSVIKFLDIDESDRNKIIKMCFQEESERLKNRGG